MGGSYWGNISELRGEVRLSHIMIISIELQFMDIFANNKAKYVTYKCSKVQFVKKSLILIAVYQYFSNKNTFCIKNKKI